MMIGRINFLVLVFFIILFYAEKVERGLYQTYTLCATQLFLISITVICRLLAGTSFNMISHV